MFEEFGSCCLRQLQCEGVVDIAVRIDSSILPKSNESWCCRFLIKHSILSDREASVSYVGILLRTGLARSIQRHEVSEVFDHLISNFQKDSGMTSPDKQVLES